jgi:xanthine dehydrogenase YagR molybdenum-binding subunit
MTGSSRSTASFAPAIAEAAGTLRDKLGKRSHVDDDSGTSNVGSDGYLEATGSYRSRAGGVSSLDRETSQGHASEHWHQAAAAAEVAVDIETFQVRVLHLHGAVYAGRTVSRERIHQQNRGSLIMGMGMAMFESLDVENGEVLNGNLSEYVIPSMEDQPRVSSSIIEALEPNAEPYGVGEMVVPAVPAALFNAVANATGRRMYNMPLRAESIWKASNENDFE